MFATILGVLIICFTVWSIIDVCKIKSYSILKRILLIFFIWILPPISLIVYYFRFSSRSSKVRNSTKIHDDVNPSTDTAFGGNSYAPKSFSSLQEFCDYLNSHDESQWRGELRSIISWNNWTDKTDCYNKICSNGFQYIEYDSDYQKYKVWTER